MRLYVQLRFVCVLNNGVITMLSSIFSCQVFHQPCSHILKRMRLYLGGGGGGALMCGHKPVCLYVRKYGISVVVIRKVDCTS